MGRILGQLTALKEELNIHPHLGRNKNQHTPQQKTMGLLSCIGDLIDQPGCTRHAQGCGSWSIDAGSSLCLDCRPGSCVKDGLEEADTKCTGVSSRLLE